MLSLMLALTLHGHATTCAETVEKEPRPPGSVSIYDHARFYRDAQRATERLQERHGRAPGVYVFDIPFEWRFYRKRQLVPIYVVTDAALITAALRSPELIDRQYPHSPAMRVKGGAESLLVVADSDPAQQASWQITHDVMMPFFTPRWVRTEYTAQVREEAARLADAWGRTGDRIVNGDLESFALANVLKPIFGMSHMPERSASFSKDLHEFFEQSGESEMRDARRRLEDLVRPAVEQAKARPDGEGLVQRLLAVGKPDEYVYDQLITTYFAGQLTTKVMLGLSLHFLTEHPEWQERLRDEYARGDADMPLTANFLNETLRRYPPVPELWRYTTKRVKLGEHVIPENRYVDLNVYAALHDPRVWGEDAKQFRPERWEGRQLRNGDFCPFGWGPRVCIGQHLAMLEGKLLLGEVLKRYRVEKAASFTPPDAFMGKGVAYLNPLKLRFVPR